MREEIDSCIGRIQAENFWTASCEDGRLLLLDVGSCFNPFKQFKQFSAVPVDISPATEDVIQCDFLNLKFNESFEVGSEDKSTETGTVDSCKTVAENCLRNGSPLMSYFD